MCVDQYDFFAGCGHTVWNGVTNCGKKNTHTHDRCYSTTQTEEVAGKCQGCLKEDDEAEDKKEEKRVQDEIDRIMSGRDTTIQDSQVRQNTPSPRPSLMYDAHPLYSPRRSVFTVVWQGVRSLRFVP